MRNPTAAAVDNYRNSHRTCIEGHSLPTHQAPLHNTPLHHTGTRGPLTPHGNHPSIHTDSHSLKRTVEAQSFSFCCTLYIYKESLEVGAANVTIYSSEYILLPVKVFYSLLHCEHVD